MSDGRFRQYYWRIRTLLSEKNHLLNMDHPAYEMCEDYEIEYTGTFRATIVFRDDSRLTVRFTLESDGDIQERNYAYIYLDAHGNRVFQYDDAPHHPELSTHPHHVHRGQRPARGRDKALSLDIPRVDFVTVLQTVCERLEKSKAAGG
jgi:hypothetical protein